MASCTAGSAADPPHPGLLDFEDEVGRSNMVTSFRQWLSRPVDYAWVVSYFQANTALTTTRVLIGLSCWTFSALYLLAAFGPSTGPTGFGLVAVLVNSVCTAGVGLAWIVGPWPSKRVSLAFVAYADVGLGLVVLLLQNALAVLPLTILLDRKSVV